MDRHQINEMLLTEFVSRQQLDALEKKLDKIFKVFNIDVDLSKKHFLDRINDKRNPTPITIKELSSLFKKTLKKFGAKLASINQRGYEAVLKDLASDINIPFVLSPDPKNGEVDLIAKTAMKKKGFKTSNPVFALEHIILDESKMKMFTMDQISQWLKDDNLKMKAYVAHDVIGSKGFRIYFTNKYGDTIQIKKNKTRPLQFSNEIEAMEYLKNYGITDFNKI